MCVIGTRGGGTSTIQGNARGKKETYRIKSYLLFWADQLGCYCGWVNVGLAGARDIILQGSI